MKEISIASPDGSGKWRENPKDKPLVLAWTEGEMIFHLTG
jgi:hypothetical protein